jgi:hypothetical protein
MLQSQRIPLYPVPMQQHRPAKIVCFKTYNTINRFRQLRMIFVLTLSEAVNKTFFPMWVIEELRAYKLMVSEKNIIQN